MSDDKTTSKCDLADLKRVVTLMKQHDLAEVEWEPGKKIRVVRGGMVVAQAAVAAAPVVASAVAPAAAPAAAPKESRGTEIPSPMVGTFYRSPSPDASPYVEVGDRISKDTPVCIVEAMKVMNEIKSEVSGEILEILVQNGEPVEFGQPLFLVRPAGGAG